MGREKSEKQNYFCYNPYNGIAGNFEIPISPTLQTHEKATQASFSKLWFISFYDCKDKYTWSIVV